MPVVAHCTALYLHTNGSWLYNQIAGLQRYEPVVLAQETANLDEFPVARLHSAQRLTGPTRLYNRLVRKLTGEYPLYGRILRQERAVLIHAHFGYQGPRCLRARRQSGLPLVTSFYGADATEFARIPVWQRRYRRLFAIGEGFLVEGSAMAAQLERIGCPPSKIRVNHLGVDLQRLPFRERSGGGEARLLMCAGFREKKGFAYGLEALAKVRDRGVSFRLVLIGDGPERPRLMQLLQDLGLAAHTDVLGVQPYSAVLEELQRCDVLLQPSVTAANGDTEGGAPVILLDAQACGMPVVATRHADIPEYVRDGVSGLLAPERDPEALSACLLQLLGNPAGWAAMGRAGRRHVEIEYDAAVQAQRLEAIYDDYLAARTGGTDSSVVT
jgi:colanic acid/amylovoran biosynthesis glycosyltransferase